MKVYYVTAVPALRPTSDLAAAVRHEVAKFADRGAAERYSEALSPQLFWEKRVEEREEPSL